jgi:hypothetical protein
MGEDNFGLGKSHSELATMIFERRVHSEGPQGSLEAGNLVTRQQPKKRRTVSHRCVYLPAR